MIHFALPLFIVSQCVLCTKVIFNGMHASTSHIVSMIPIATRLRNDGHCVHFLESHNKPTPFKYPANISYTYIQLPEDEFFSKQVLPGMWTKIYGAGQFPFVWMAGDEALVDMYINHNEKLNSVMNETWDLAFVDEIFAVSSYALGLKAKERGDVFILLSTSVSVHIFRYYLSLGSTQVERPSLFIPIGERFRIEWFRSRLQAFVDAMRIFVAVEYITTYMSIRGLALLGIYNFHISQLTQQAAYYYVDDLNQLVWPYTISSDFMSVGYICPTVLQLDGEYLEFVSDPRSNGTILIAFGSNVLWTYAPDKFMKNFVEAINRLSEYRIVFAFNGRPEQVKDVKSHCKITKWAPQKEILFHSKTKAYVTHGGLKSTKDTICGEVPILVMPLFAEQNHNAEISRAAGYAEILSKFTLTADELEQNIRRLAEDPKYKRAVVRMRKFMLDRPIDSLDLAAFGARRAIKCRGRYPTFKIKGMYLSLSVFANLDILMTVLGFCLFLGFSD